MMLSRPRTLRLAGSPVVRYATLVFLLAAGLIGTVTFALDRSARNSTWREHSVALAGGAQVGASSFESLHTSLRIEATQMATSLALQRAIVQRDDSALRRIAVARHARIDLGARSIGSLPAGQRIVSTASITDGVHRLATISLAIPLDGRVVTLLRRATPLPQHGGFLLTHDGVVLAGGPVGEPVAIRQGKLSLRGTEFAAQSASLKGTRLSLVAVEPVSSIDALSAQYRRLLFLAAAVTLLLVAFVARRIARPLAAIVGDVARLSRQAHTDALTGLANRRELTVRLHDELERAARNETSLSLLVVDVDDFKSINDGHGHQAGDEAIKAVASLLAGSVRETDLAVRLGGEEFVVLLPGARIRNATATAEKLRLAIEELEIRASADVTIRLTASFGIAEFPTYATADALFSAADSALYQAKRAGKNRVATATVQRATSTARRPAHAPAPSAS
jgi:diguanylate cyclase (GGDEF)-like protein